MEITKEIIIEDLIHKKVDAVRYLMEKGITILDPDSTFIDTGVSIGQDTIIHPFTIIQKNTEIGSFCNIGPGTTIMASKIGNQVDIIHSYVEYSNIQDNSTIGPFAHLRPNAIIEKNVKIGNFVEIKNSIIKEESKVSHLTYLGDAEIGKSSNIGAGTITCNFDGVKKNRTKIGNNTFIGSNNTLVAPIEIGDNAYTGAGSTLTKNVPAYSLALGRERQVNKIDWVKSKRREKNE